VPSPPRAGPSAGAGRKGRIGWGTGSARMGGMRFEPIERPAEAFQQPVTPGHIQRIARRWFGRDAVSAAELGLGMYNTTYKVMIEGRERPVVMRFAPEPGRQARSERELMRNE